MNLSICEFVAGVSATLNYENEGKVPVEAFFVFPMDEDSAVYNFEALVDGKKIVAELQDKMKVPPPGLFPYRMLIRTTVKGNFTESADVKSSSIPFQLLVS